MGEQLIAHGFDQGFRSLGIKYPEQKLGRYLHRGNNDYCQRQNPHMLSQIGKTTDAVYKIHNKTGKISFFPPDGAVHRRTNDLRLQHICQCGNGRRQNTDSKKPLGTF